MGQNQPKEGKFDIDKLAKGQHLSETVYYKIKEFNDNICEIENQDGRTFEVTTSIISEMESADHYDKEIPMNMTSLAEFLVGLGDKGFTCSFRKLPTIEAAEEQLEKLKYSELKDPKKLAKLVDDVLDGETCTLTGHLVKAENNLGRSLVVDLNATTTSKLRQIDHRTIQYIIVDNAKYFLKKGAKKIVQDESDGEKIVEKWNP